jgi:hypothetical protein
MTAPDHATEPFIKHLARTGASIHGFSWCIAVLLRKPQVLGYWISLDFLGFSRPDRDLSMGYAKKPEKNFSSRFCRRERSVETAAHDLGMAKGRIAHAASLTKFLIFCTRLPPAPFPFGRLNPKAARSSRRSASLSGRD